MPRKLTLKRSKSASKRVIKKNNNSLTEYLVTETKDQNHSTAITNRLFQLFLPVGYPTSVRSGYTEYQLWDVLQGLTSYLRGNLAYQSTLVSLGVGDVKATATAGALTKIVGDTCSMLGSLLFTYFFSDDFGFNVRQWRLFADVSNDIGLTLHFLAPLFGKEWFVTVSVIASLMTTMCGISAGATKAYISSHFALEDNLTDLVAKEGSQETFVNIIGLLGGYFLLASVGSVEQSGTAVFITYFVLTIIHVIANMCAIHYLTFSFLNEQRFQLVFNEYNHNDIDNDINYQTICRKETFLPFFFSTYHPTSNQVILGADHRTIDDAAVRRALSKLRSPKDSNYVIIIDDTKDETKCHVLLKENATKLDILQSRYECEMIIRSDINEKNVVVSKKYFLAFKVALMNNGWELDKSKFYVGRTRYRSWP